MSDKAACGRYISNPSTRDVREMNFDCTSGRCLRCELRNVQNTSALLVLLTPPIGCKCLAVNDSAHYVYICIYIYIYVCMCVCARTYRWIDGCVPRCKHTFVRTPIGKHDVRMSVCAYVCTYSCSCMCALTNACMHVACAHTCKCAYLHTHTSIYLHTCIPTYIHT